MRALIFLIRAILTVRPVVLVHFEFFAAVRAFDFIHYRHFAVGRGESVTQGLVALR